MKSQGLNGLRTRSRSLLFLMINFFSFCGFVLVKLKLPKFHLSQWTSHVIKWLIWYGWISFNGINLPFDFSLSSLQWHISTYWFQISWPFPTFSLPFLSFFLSSFFLKKNTIAFVCGSLIMGLTAILISSKLPNCLSSANPIISTPQVTASSKDD